MIYLDYQATTPLAPEVFDAMLPWLTEHHANPHSGHASGRAGRAALDVARDDVAALFPPGGRIVFTSGATEALNLAIRGSLPEKPESGRNRILAIATEHPAVLETIRHMEACGFELVILPVGSDGIVDLVRAEAEIDERTALVAAMLVNNEIGTIQPVEQVAALAKAAGALVLSDAVQAYGRVPIPGNIDMSAISAHKFHGPKGIGAMWVRDGVSIAPLLYGGGQEDGMRAGTLSPALCVGLGAAARLAKEKSESDEAHVAMLWDAAQPLLDGWTINGSTVHRYKGNLSIRRDGLDTARLLSDLRDMAFSLGSACASGSGKPSHVLAALGLSKETARTAIRLGYGRYTTREELIEGLNRINEAAASQSVAA